MAAEHGTRTRYNTGCRCDSCKQANRDYDKMRRQKLLASKHSPGTVTTLRAAETPDTEVEIGAVEAGVLAEISGLSTVGSRQGLVQIAIALAKVLDTPLAIAQHSAAGHRLSETLDKLRKGADSKAGKLAAVRQMTRGNANEAAG